MMITDEDLAWLRAMERNDLDIASGGIAHEVAEVFRASAARWRRVISSLARTDTPIAVTDEMVEAALQVDFDTWPQSPRPTSEEALNRGRAYYRAVLTAALHTAHT